MSVRWYGRFKKTDERVKGVLNYYRRRDLLTMKVITAENAKGVHNYAVFDSHINLLNFINESEPAMRIFNERIDENQLQKPRFDIDIDLTKTLLDGYSDIVSLGEYVKDCVIEGILTELGSKVSLDTNILVYSSHSAKKSSYHILVDGWYHFSCYDALGFYEKVVPSNIRPYVDSKIYDRNHPLRMLHCHKRLDTRVKVFNDVFAYKGQLVEHVSRTLSFRTEAHKAIHIFGLSLVTFTSGSLPLPPYASPKEERPPSSVIDDDICAEIVDMMASKLTNPDNYEIVSINGNFINLKRLEREHCILCDKEHDANFVPFIFMVGRSIFWTCGRTKEYVKNGPTKVFLGYVQPDMSVFDSIDDEEADNSDLSSQIAALIPNIVPNNSVDVVTPTVSNTSIQPVKYTTTNSVTIAQPVKYTANHLFDLNRLASMSISNTK